MSEKELVKPIPESRSEAILREVVAFIPLLGDLFCLIEASEAFRKGKTLPALMYLINFLPGPPLPITHLLVYELEKREIEKELKIK
jgi:hypothetical protein